MTYVELRGHAVRPVSVLVGDHWRDGQLEAYQRDAGGTWRGLWR